MTSEKRTRKTVINEKMKLVEKTIIAKEKEGVVLEKEVFDAMEKSVTADADMTKVFARKGVTFKCSFCETKKEIEVLEQNWDEKQ